ncbi:hydroxymethylglutaryl-CoA lyase [Pseudooctadecabacter jejudonensis]|uniref:Hydroxymethylglutaryl-CoA lyase YngG n=1 Tax=Pseudooctadecabacter jejudonensis TaxID=1391910 RepID=A0A1Y5S8N6_9RHOB|nr:hydroxymethylglutaryl-CoA lyase [Pseudooctadecabacter jejudonensis]SLN34870.1 Hydroxymethylglutaryl-CoA lyase YngG [Pseudooctadecabacter jejudonensis]
MTDHVTLFEMAPRDGLQNESGHIPTADKIRLIDLLSATGLTKIEATSFVSPKWVPQMADAADVMAGLTRTQGVLYSALTPNTRGFDAAITAGADEVAVFASASEGFSKANLNCTIEESLNRYRPVAKAAESAGVPLRGYVSCITDCPYDGPTPPDNVARVASDLIDMGCYEISLGDTIGHGTPKTVARVLDTLLHRIPASRLAGHFHDTKGHALDNIKVGLDRGLRSFDSAAGGLGGCPYAPGAAGNVATEAVVNMLHANGFTTGIDPERLSQAAVFAQSLRT